MGPMVNYLWRAAFVASQLALLGYIGWKFIF